MEINRGILLMGAKRQFSRRRRFTPNCRRYHRTKSFRPVIRRPPITMLFSARLRPPSHTQSFLNSKFGMTLVHLKIEKYRISRPRPIDGSDLVLTEWTPHRKSTHRVKIKVGFGDSQRASAVSGRPAAPPCPAGLVLVWPSVTSGRKQAGNSPEK